jgi:hypothetical protein
MRVSWLLRALRFLVFVATAIVVAGVVVMALWNWLVPSLTGWHSLTFPQAITLLVLCRILFGGFRGRGGPWMHGRFRKMSPEERERFREEMRARCGRATVSPSEGN